MRGPERDERRGFSYLAAARMTEPAITTPPVVKPSHINRGKVDAQH
jgi:hypothetical protein